jgi:hypothetical protein
VCYELVSHKSAATAIQPDSQSVFVARWSLCFCNRTPRSLAASNRLSFTAAISRPKLMTRMAEGDGSPILASAEGWIGAELGCMADEATRLAESLLRQVAEQRLANRRLGNSTTRRLGPHPARVRCSCARLHNRSVPMCSVQVSEG